MSTPERINHSEERARSYKTRLTGESNQVTARREIEVAYGDFVDGKWQVIERGFIRKGQMLFPEGDSGETPRGREVLVRHPSRPRMTAVVSTGALDLVIHFIHYGETPTWGR